MTPVRPSVRRPRHCSRELGALFEQKASQGGDTAALSEALTAYEGALRRDPRCRPAARALVSLYRTLGQKPNS